MDPRIYKSFDERDTAPLHDAQEAQKEIGNRTSWRSWNRNYKILKWTNHPTVAYRRDVQFKIL